MGSGWPLRSVITGASGSRTASASQPAFSIATGTPPGVGYFREPRRLLRGGDEVVVEIDAIGRLRTRWRRRAEQSHPRTRRLAQPLLHRDRLTWLAYVMLGFLTAQSSERMR